MSNKKKLIPALRFPEFKEDGEWEEKRLGEVSTVITKGTTPTSIGFNFSDYGINFIKIESIVGGRIDPSKVSYISKDCHNALRRSQLHAGDILFSIAGALGVVAQINNEILPANTNQALSIIRLKRDYNKEFIKKYLLSPLIKTEISKIRAGAAQPNLSLKQVGDFRILLPDPQEQQKIADCLSSLDDLLAAHNEKLELLKGHKKGLMQNLFPQEGERVPKFRFPEFENNGEWEEKKLGEICSLKAGKFVAASEINDSYTEGLHPCYGGNGLRGYTQSYTHTGRYSLIGRQGAHCGNITLADGIFHATEHAVVVSPNSKIDTDWLFYTLELANLNQYATGQAQPGLSVSNLEEVEFVFPNTIPEQQKIASCLSAVDDLIKAETEKIEALKEHKKGLMQGLFPKMEN